MDLTSDEIRRRDFQVGMRGYDTTEVRAFLGQVADAFDRLLARSAEPPAPDELYGLLGQEVAEVLRNARSVASDLVNQAEASAAEMREQAERMVKEARAEEETIRQQTSGVLAAAQHDRDTLLEDAVIRQEAVARAESRVKHAAEEVAKWLESAERTFASIRADLPDKEVAAWIMESDRPSPPSAPAGTAPAGKGRDRKDSPERPPA